MKREKLQKKLADLQKMKKKVEASLSTAPEGILLADMHKGKYPQYYLSEETGNRRRRKYLKKEKMDFIQKLAQREYDEKFLQALIQQEKAIRYYLKNYKENELIKIYQQLPVAKRKIVAPYILTDEQYLEKWRKKKSTIANTYPITNSLLTENGEQVRSKSEKMIADKLLYMGIPYKYEEPLEISKSRFIFPDFTILNVRERKEVYLEHFGIMDNPEYCKKAIEKVEAYQANGIYMGENLIITMESSMKGINLQYLERLIKNVLGLR